VTIYDTERLVSSNFRGDTEGYTVSRAIYRTTDSQLRGAKPRDKEYLIPDGGNLYLRVRPDKSKSWIFIYKTGGKQRRMGLGSYPDVSLEIARKNATNARALIKGQKIDPIDKARKEKQQQLENRASEIPRTVVELFATWKTDKLAQWKDEGKRVTAYFERDVLPVIGHMHPDEVRRRHIFTIRDNMRKRTRTVTRLSNQVLSWVRQMYKLGLVREFCEIDPTSGIEKEDFGGHEHERIRALEPSEVELLFERLPKSKLSKTAQLAIWLQIATTTRIGELTKWEHVSFEKQTLFIPKDNRKGSFRRPAKDHTVFLSSFAVSQLRQLMKLTGQTPFLFPHKWHPEAHAPVNSVRRQLKSEPIELPNGHWTPHDLRRTGSTLMLSLGVRREVADGCLSHIDPVKVRRTYQHYDYQKEMRSAWEMLGDLLVSLEKGQPILAT